MRDLYRVTPEKPVFKALFYALPGGGKTTLAASAQDHPDLANVLFANVEGGLLSVSHRGDIHAIDISSTKELEEFYWALRKGEFEGVNTAVIDSATETQTVNLEAIVTEAIRKEKDKGASSSGKVHTRDDIWQDDYGKSTVQLKRLFRWFKDLPINIIFTALAKFVYPKVPPGTDTSQIEPLVVVPALTAKLGESLMGYVDFVWYLRHVPEENIYQVLTRSDGIYRAKTRGPKFAEAIGQVFNLNMNKMMMPQIYDLYCQSQAEKKPKSKKAK